MKTFTRRMTLALGVSIAFASMVAGCTQSRDAGAPIGQSASLGQGGSGGGTGTGGGTGSGGSTTQQAAGALYGDLYVIERDGNGEPKTRTIDKTGGPYICQQPLKADCTFLPLNGDKDDFNPELEDACAVQADFTDFLQAVSFGRESVARAPATVIDKAYGEAIKSINAATPGQCMKLDGETPDARAIKLDPSGRITNCLASDAGTYAWKTIDAPLENLGLYRALMTGGCFAPVEDTKRGEEGTIIKVTYQLDAAGIANLNAAKVNPGDDNDPGLSHVVCSGTLPNPVTKPDMLSAAVFLAAGADKTSPVTLDEVINLNNYVGVNKWTYTTSKKVKTLSITYFKFDAFKYVKGTDACQLGKDNPNNIATLLTTGNGKSFELKDVDVFGGSPDGVYLRPEPPDDLPGVEVTVCRGGSPLLGVVCDVADASGCGGANWFTQAAEDARKTIWFLHNYEPPVYGY